MKRLTIRATPHIMAREHFVLEGVSPVRQIDCRGKPESVNPQLPNTEKGPKHLTNKIMGEWLLESHKVYLLVKYLQLLVVYGSLASLGGDVDDDTDMTFILVLKKVRLIK